MAWASVMCRVVASDVSCVASDVACRGRVMCRGVMCRVVASDDVCRVVAVMCAWRGAMWRACRVSCRGE